MGRPQVLYLNTRALELEREAEIAAAERSGIGLVIATPSPEAYATYHVDHLIQAPLGRDDEAEEVIVGHLRAEGIAVEGVVAWTDKEVELTARLAARLGLKGSRVEAAQTARNKVRTRRALASVPGANPRFAVLRDESDVGDALREVGTPALLKPAGASGGRGQFLVAEEDEALQRFRDFRAYCDPRRDDIFGYYRDEALLEQALSGSEHSVAGMVVGGEVHVLAVADKRVDRRIPWQYQSAIPSRLPPPDQDAVVRMARAAVRAVGIDYCGFHVDMMVGADGPKVLEVGGRLGGECINSHLIPLSGETLAPYEWLLDVVRGRNPFVQEDYRGQTVRQVAFRHLLPPRPGRLRRLEGAELIRRHPRVRALHLTRAAGARLEPPHVAYNSLAVGYVVADCPLEQDIDALLDGIAGGLRIEVE